LPPLSSHAVALMQFAHDVFFPPSSTVENATTHTNEPS
jgi:hypothetical protein